ncbi:MAG: sugar ABC transporter permease [Kiloniellaceae bacterium]
MTSNVEVGKLETEASKRGAQRRAPVEEFSRLTGLDTRLLAMLGALVVIWIVLDILAGGLFLTPRNLFNLAVQGSAVGIMATGMVLVIVARHIDLSVGSVLGFIGMSIAFLQVEILPLGAAWNWPLTILAGLALGAVVGVWQGLWVAYGGVPAFVVTLGGLLIFRGGAFEITDGRTVAPLDPVYQLLGGGVDGSIGATASWALGLVAVAAVVYFSVRARGKRARYGFPLKPLWAEVAMICAWSAIIIGFVMVMNAYTKPRSDIPRGIPVPVLILLGVVLIMTFISRFTKFGRYVFAMGGNPEAAALSGINVKRTTVMIFVVMGVLCAVAAVVTTARLNAGTNSMGTLAELNVIAAAVIGGTSLAGGIGTIPGAILGAVIMQSLDNGMVLLGVSSSLRSIVIGLVLVAAVWFDVVYNRNRR